MAIYGPFARTVISTVVAHKTINWYRQTPPYLERLTYEMVSRYKLSGTVDVRSANITPLNQSPAYQPALNMAYEQFKSKVHEKAELAVSLAERKQAVDMVAKRLGQLTSFVRNLRKGDLSGALKALGYKPPKQGPKKLSNQRKQQQWEKWRRRARKSPKPVSDTYNEAFDGFAYPSQRAIRRFRKEHSKTIRNRGEVASDIFLEFHFGWAPLVKDIGTAIDVLQKPFNAVASQGRGRAKRSSGSKPAPWTFDVTSTWEWESRVQLQADIRVTNPNLYLANQLGLVNPLSVAWELVPFSFVLGWFSNVSSFLAQATEFLGLELLRSSTTHLVQVTDAQWYGDRGFVPQIYSTKWICMRRSSGISKPALQLKPFKGFSLTRGLTAASLLLQQLKNVK